MAALAAAAAAILILAPTFTLAAPLVFDFFAFFLGIYILRPFLGLSFVVILLLFFSSFSSCSGGAAYPDRHWDFGH